MRRWLAAMAAFVIFATLRADGIHWLETVHDFGAFDESIEKVTAYFKFVNETGESVMITQASSTCGCTVPSYSREPIAPGDTATIEVAYNAAGRPGRFSKQVFVRTTESPERYELKVKGTVIGSERSVKSRYPVDMGALKLRSGAAMIGKVKKGQGKTEYIDGYNQSGDSIRIKFANVPSYLEVGTVPDVVPPGDLVSINFYFRADRCKEWGIVTDSIKVCLSNDNAAYTLPVVAIVEEDFSKLSEEELAKAPILTYEGDRIDIGPIPFNSKKPVEAKLELKNRGERALKIRKVYSQDPNMQVKVTKNEIKKGKTADLIVTYDPANQPVGIVNTRITIITNDPAAATRTIRVVGERK